MFGGAHFKPDRQSAQTGASNHLINGSRGIGARKSGACQQGGKTFAALQFIDIFTRRLLPCLCQHHLGNGGGGFGQDA